MGEVAEEILARIDGPEPLSIFLSYSRIDAARIVDQIAGALTALHVKVFLDRLGIDSGDQWKARIREAVGESCLFVSIESRAAPTSQWMARELDWARELGIAVLALQLPRASTRPEIKERLSLKHVAAGRLTDAQLTEVVRQMRVRAAMARVQELDRVIGEIDEHVKNAGGQLRVIGRGALRIISRGNKVSHVVVATGLASLLDFYTAATLRDRYQEQSGTSPTAKPSKVVVSRLRHATEQHQKQVAWLARASAIRHVDSSEIGAWVKEELACSQVP
jgi:hypothetical protein